jgi:hypothetical protein
VFAADQVAVEVILLVEPSV